MNCLTICEVSPPRVPCNHPRRYPAEWQDRSLTVKLACNRKCEVRGCPSDTVLTVHHCDHNKRNNTHPAFGDDAASSNLIALCARCHLWALGMERGYGVLTRPETLRRLAERIARFKRLSATGLFGATAKRARQGGAA